MSATDHNQQRLVAAAEEPEPGTTPKPAPAAESAETGEPDVAAQEEPATKPTVLVTVSNFVCAALGYATSVR